LRLTGVAEGGTVHPVLLDSAVDFIRTYADRTHHGKEEDILFRDLAKKDLSAQDQSVMQELINEHTYARQRCGIWWRPKSAT
jgi:hemerythrin-like domain-containing protein